MSDSYEYVVVGGGIMGVTSAWWLVTAGASVALVEKEDFAAGASGGPGKRGFRRCGRDLRELPLASQTIDRWTEINEAIGGDPLIDHTGGVLLTNVPLDGSLGGSNLHHMAELQNRYGIPTEVLTLEQVQEHEPHIGGDTIGGLFVPGDGSVDHTRATKRVAAAVIERGVDVIKPETVTAVRPGVGKTEVELASGRVITATKAVLVATNGLAPLLIEPLLRATLPIWDCVTQVVMARKAQDHPVLNGLVNHTSRQISIKMVNDDDWMLTGGSRGRWDPKTRTGYTVPEITQRKITEAVAIAPVFEGAVVVDIDASRPESSVPDLIPLVDRIDSDVPVYYATAFSGHGFAIAPAATRHLTDWIRSGGERPRELRDFGVSRFLP